jgi:hypothetical protein
MRLHPPELHPPLLLHPFGLPPVSVLQPVQPIKLIVPDLLRQQLKIKNSNGNSVTGLQAWYIVYGKKLLISYL